MSVVAVAAPQATTKPAVKTETEYFAVFMDGKKIGHCKRTRQASDGKVTTSETMVITISRGTVAITLRTSDTDIETTDGKPLGFKAISDIGIMATTIEGTVTPAGKVNVTITTGQSVQKRVMDWPEGALMSEGLRILAKKKGLTEGTKYTVRTFASLTLRAEDEERLVGPTKNVDLLGRVVPLTEIKTTTKGVSATYYVDKNFRDQKFVLPAMGMNLEIVACSRVFALSKNDVADFLSRFLLSPPQPLKNVASAKSIIYTLAPTGKAKLHFPATDNQTVRNVKNGSVIVTVRPVKAEAGATFPYKGKDKTALSALKTTRFVQCDDKKIKSLARKAVGDTKDTAEAARRIEKFVRKYIKKKDLSVGYASAVEVAASRQGDCTEHAVLTAALCRAIGIPAQVVTGVAYVENFGGRKGVFGPHAWNRVLIGDKWIGFDAALNGYDAGHITLTTGDGSPDDFFGIISTLGYFKIAKVTIQK